jgi:pyruvate dehydrogenase E1 component alpha subunit
MAAVFGAPAILFCQNNGWAISVPSTEQFAAPIAARAAGYGFPGVRVDGNDVLAVYVVTREAVERARSGGGPTLIEAMTYRVGAHSTADDASRYRDEAEVEAWRARDPIERYRRWLLATGLVDDGWTAGVDAEAETWVAEIRAALTALGPPPAFEVFDHAFAEPPATMRRQRGELVGDG